MVRSETLTAPTAPPQIFLLSRKASGSSAIGTNGVLDRRILISASRGDK